MQEFDFKYTSKVTEILPNTERTKKLRMRKLEEERLKKQEKEKHLLQKQQMELEQNKLKEIQDKQRKLELERKKLEEQRKQEEMQTINTLKGQFGQMINELKSNATTLDYTISGLNLHSAQVRILVKAVEQNESLKGLIFSRKNIKDIEGVEIANNLKKNSQLERLELEGNFLGPETTQAIASLITENATIRVIDLEGNNLTNNFTNLAGIEALAKAMETNQTLLCLQLCNTHLNAKCSELLMRMIERNTTLISLDIDQNPEMDLNHVRAIQECLKRNKKAYDDERYKEFVERKRMWVEEQISEILHMKEVARKKQKELINVRIEAKRQSMEEQWKKDMEQKEIERLKLIQKLEKEAKLKGTKRRRRGGGKGGKKK